MDKSLIAAAVFEQHAGLYEQKYMDVGAYAHSINQFCNLLVEDASVLEIGCGPGNLTRQLLTKKPACRVYGIDLSTAMVNRAIVNNPAATFAQMDCRRINEIRQRFDAVLAGFCIPYLDQSEVNKLFVDAYCLLNPNGILYLSCMEGDYNKSGWETSSSGDRLYIHYYDEASLKQMLLTTGFVVLYEGRVQSPKNNERVSTDLILVAGKQTRKL